MKPYIIKFGPWMPDGANLAFGMQFQFTQTEVPLADVSGLYYASGGYRSTPSLVAGAGLPSASLGVSTAFDSTGNAQIYAGAGSDLYHYNGTAWVAVSKSAGAYSGATQWSFVDFGGCIIAADGVHPMQDMAVGGAAFADVTAAPLGNVLGVINQSLIVGDITSPTAFPYRIQWSGIGDPTSWPTPLTDAAVAAQSGYEDLTQDFGRVLFIGGGPQTGVILQRYGITRGQYVGGDVVYQFLPYERKRGVVSRGAAVQVGLVTFYLSDDGFHATDGSQSQDIGTGQRAAIDRYTLDNLNWSAVNAISAGWDATLRNVVFAIPTGVNTLPDTLLMYNPNSQQWTKTTQSVERVWPDNNGTQHRLGLINQSHALSYLTGSPSSGYAETYDMSFVDGLVRDIPEAQPHSIGSGTQTMRIGSRIAADQAKTYTADVPRDSFSQRCAFDPQPSGLLLSARVTTTNTDGLNGATLYFTDGTFY